MTYVDRSLTIDGLHSHVIEGGRGYPIMLIHGSGPGASTVGNWRPVLDPLAERFHVFAMDLIGFGRSGKKVSPPFFDIELWLRQCRQLLRKIQEPRIGVLAHSLSAALALRLAGSENELAQVLTTGAMGAPFLVNEATIRAWTFPKTREDLRLTAELLLYDHSLIDDAYLDARTEVLHSDNAYEAYFDAMFAGDKQRFVDRAVLSRDELRLVTCPITMLHGREDVAFPPALSLDLGKQLLHADVTLLSDCSHSVAMEFPDKLVSAAMSLFK